MLAVRPEDRPGFDDFKLLAWFAEHGYSGDWGSGMEPQPPASFVVKVEARMAEMAAAAAKEREEREEREREAQRARRGRGGSCAEPVMFV